MPYIKKEYRREYDRLIKPIVVQVECVGELNYVITSMILKYLQMYNISYGELNEMIGLLEAVKLEIYRRMVAPYEDKKCEENGDVF